MKKLILQILLILLLAPLLSAGYAGTGPDSRPGGFIVAGLAPDEVPAGPSEASPSGEKVRSGESVRKEQADVREEVRRYLGSGVLLPFGRSWRDREKFWAAPSDTGPEQGEKTNGSAWNEFYYRNFRLSLSTMPGEDDHLKRLTPWEIQETKRWERFQSLPDQLRSGSYRETLEGVGVIVEPRIRLGIEF